MSKTIQVILPLPHREVTDKFCIPLHFFPAGLKDLAVHALEFQNDYEGFVQQCVHVIEEKLSLPENYEIAEQMRQDLYALYLEVSLYNFFNCFIKDTRSILGQQTKMEFIRVVSYRTIGAICVEFAHDTNITPEIPDRRAKRTVEDLRQAIKKYRATYY